MNKILIAIAIQLALGTATAHALPTPKAVSEAIAIDVCSDNGSLSSKKVAGERLSKRNRKLYDDTRATLDAQYAKSGGTDSQVEAVRVAFCVNR